MGRSRPAYFIMYPFRGSATQQVDICWKHLIHVRGTRMSAIVTKERDVVDLDSGDTSGRQESGEVLYHCPAGRGRRYRPSIGREREM